MVDRRNAAHGQYVDLLFRIVKRYDSNHMCPKSSQDMQLLKNILPLYKKIQNLDASIHNMDHPLNGGRRRIRSSKRKHTQKQNQKQKQKQKRNTRRLH